MSCEHRNIDFCNAQTNAQMAYVEAEREVARLETENAKLREENKRLRTVAVRYYTELLHSDDVLGQIMARKKLQELGIKVDS